MNGPRQSRLRSTLVELLAVAEPTVEASWLDALRHDLDVELGDLVVGLDPADGPLRVTKSTLGAVLACERNALAALGPAGRSSPSAAGVLGQLVDRALHHHVLCGPLEPAMAYDVAVDALVAEGATDTLDWLTGGEAWARTNVTEHAHRLVEAFGQVPSRWWPRCERDAQVMLAHGSILATARFDLQLGGPGSGHGTVIVEVKSGGRVGEQLDDARWYALVAALRDRIAPVAVVTFWSADSAVATEPVRTDLLESAARRLVAGTRRLAGLARGHVPTTSSGPRCRWCPVRDHCADGLEWMAAAGARVGGVDGGGAIDLDDEEDPGAW